MEPRDPYGNILGAVQARFLQLQEKYLKEEAATGEPIIVAEALLESMFQSLAEHGFADLLRGPQAVAFADFLGQMAKQCFLYGYLWAKSEEERRKH